MEVIIIFLAWILFSYVIAELIPALFTLTGYALCFLALCVFECAKFTLKVAAWAAVWIARGVIWAGVRSARGVIRASAQTGLFIFILIDEWRRGPDAGADADETADDEADEAAEDEADAAVQDPYAAACALLGLEPGFTRAALHSAYKQAMKHAHPDAGGNTQDAQAVNAARDLLRPYARAA